MKKATLKTIESNDLVSLYSICFDNAEESEFENFLSKFKEESTLNKDFQTILAQKKGNITIEKNYIIGLEGATFEL